MHIVRTLTLSTAFICSTSACKDANNAEPENSEASDASEEQSKDKDQSEDSSKSDEDEDNGDTETPGDTPTTDDKQSESESDSDPSSDDESSDESDSDTENTDDDTDTGDDDCKLGEWKDNRSDKRLPSQIPPCNIPPSKAPMFVVLGWDDNGTFDGLRWALELAKSQKNPDGSNVTFTFYNTGTYAGQVGELWKQAFDSGHEVGNHTQTHNIADGSDVNGEELDAAQWKKEVNDCEAALDETGISKENLWGFRAPRLEENDAMMSVIYDDGYMYDCSIGEGTHWEQDGTNNYWPYTLDEGSPGDQYAEWEYVLKDNYPGLWEVPVYDVIAPDDATCPDYGCSSGLRERIKANMSWFEAESGKITGFDYNLFAQAQITGDEYLAILKYSFDLRFKGNRAPMAFGTHSDMYGESSDFPNSTPEERRKAVEAFLDYVLEFEDVRVVSAREMLDWVRNPKPL